MSSIPKVRVRVWDATGTNRARGNLVAVIDDAKDVGGSEYANEAGEMFFTIPWNHPFASLADPLKQHYEISRWSGSSYAPLFNGLIDDFDATADEVIIYGTDYLGQVNSTINGSTISYTSQSVHTIIQDRITAAVDSTQNRPTSFLTTGTIETTSTTTTVIAPFVPILDFIREMVYVLQSSTTVRSMVYVSREAPFTLNFARDRGSDKPDVRLEYGSTVDSFRFAPNYRQFHTMIRAIGQKREGAQVLYSTQSYADEVVYGRRQFADVFLDVVNQDVLDRRALRAVRRAGTPNTGVFVAINNGKVAPYGGYDLGDSVPVVINRGMVNIDAYYTIWGNEWIANKDGSEQLFLDLRPKEV